MDEIWRKREKSTYFMEEDTEKTEVQQFLQFLHKTKEIKSNKYVGVIHFEGNRINLFPKIFFDNTRDASKDAQAIHNHILWWLSYCRKIKFPNYQTSLGSTKSDFFEILIYLFSKYTTELLANTVYQQYEEIDQELSFIKGRLNTNEYISENLSKGRWHKLNCTYDAFVMDNSFNRIIKYVATLLYNATKTADNQRNLREILFILDEVSDVKVTANDCLKIQFNPFLGDFETVRDYCYLFLNNSISLDYKNDLKLFAFLLPMEYVFEDFIFGFIEKELEQVKALSQLRTTYLDTKKSFLLKPDLYLKIGEKNVIADTKYKIIYSDIHDSKNGVSQNDLYQMLAYSVRFKVEEIILFYPDTINNYQEQENEIIIKDALADETEISIKTFQLPIINRQLFEQESIENIELKNLFKETTLNLIERLEAILIPFG